MVWYNRPEDSPALIKREHHEQREKTEQRKQEKSINDTQGKEGRKEIEKGNNGPFCKQHLINGVS
jgi:hypothetical protein